MLFTSLINKCLFRTCPLKQSTEQAGKTYFFVPVSRKFYTGAQVFTKHVFVENTDINEIFFVETLAILEKHDYVCIVFASTTTNTF